MPVATAAQMRALGSGWRHCCGPGDLVVLTGPLGAGKTTLVQGLGAGLGVRGPITSPTFVIARVHPSLRGGRLWSTPMPTGWAAASRSTTWTWMPTWTAR